jgi:hypothetical protein
MKRRRRKVGKLFAVLFQQIKNDCFTQAFTYQTDRLMARDPINDRVPQLQQNSWKLSKVLTTAAPSLLDTSANNFHKTPALTCGWCKCGSKIGKSNRQIFDKSSICKLDSLHPQPRQRKATQKGCGTNAMESILQIYEGRIIAQ